MHTYRVTIDTIREQYVYEVEADNSDAAVTEAEMLAHGVGWDGAGLPTVQVEQLD